MTPADDGPPGLWPPGALPPLWTQPEVTGIGRVPIRAPLASFATREAALAGGDPPWRLPLDGAWRFRLLERPEAAPPDFAAPDLDDSDWDAIEVPVSWTLQGFGAPAYTNVVMPFATEPPAVPHRNPTGLFRRRVTLPRDWRGRRVTLGVGSAESVVFAFVNGVPVGMGKDSRLPSEFEISAHLVEGENLVALAVVQWSDASWLEDQDQWWLPGLHRSVTLSCTDRTFIADVALRAAPGAREGEGTLAAEVRVGFSAPPQPGYRVDVEVVDALGRTLARADGLEVPIFRRGSQVLEILQGMVFPGHVARASLAVPGARPWSHETPVLYRVLATLRDPGGAVLEVALQRVGFRSVEVRDGALLVNGRPVRIVGVNRHEWDDRRGRAITLDGMRRDVVLMKQHGVNAVRCSHYPDDERFYDLCDELGLYVVDEANLETHARWSSLCHDPRYQTAIVERGARMVLRDRNHPCVIAWSLGNESGYGPAHDAMAAWIRRVDPTRPLHYEGAIGHDLHAPAPVTDVVCPMYASIDSIVAWSRSRRDRRRPLILCEYSHAMGNSNGSLADYFAAFDRERGLQGGFVWEWCDHGIRVDPGETMPRWLYGGDFGETVHDENFCCDGLVWPDRTPHAGLFELKALAAPVDVEAVDLARGRVRVRNRQWWSDLGALRGSFRVEVDGRVVQRGRLPRVRVAPRSSADVELPLRRPKLAPGEEAFLTVAFETARALPWAPEGHPVAESQLPLPWRAPAPRPARTRGAVTVERDDDAIRLAAGAVAAAFDAGTGALASLRHRDRELLVSGPRLTLWRAPTDNDARSLVHLQERGAVKWADLGLEGLHVVSSSAALRAPRGGAPELSVRQTLHVPKADARVDLEIRARLLGTGDLWIDHTARIDGKLADLPRVGVVLSLAPALERLVWLGRGPLASYVDRKACARIGRFESSVTEQWVPHVRPQSDGNHTDTRWCALSSADGSGLLVGSPRPFEFTALHFEEEDLARARHAHELVPRPEVVLHLDARHRGVGTGSCGPDALPRYRLRPGVHRFSFRLRPFGPGEDPARLAREAAPRRRV